MTASALIIVIGLAFWILTCLAVLDIARRDFGTTAKKAIWGLVSVIPFLGPLIYFCIGMRQGKPKTGPA